MRKTYCLAGLALSVALAGCASTQPVAYSSIASSPKLESNPNNRSGRVPYTYEAEVDWRQYRRVVIEPVEIYAGQDNQFEKISEEDKQQLADFMRQEFTRRLGKVLEVTDQPTRDTIRVKLTLTGAKTTPTLGPVFRIDLAGGPYNAVQGMRGKEGAMMGSVMYAVEIEDATTHRLLSAYVTKQYPNAMNIKASFGPMGASKTGIRKGAEELARKLSRKRA